MDRAASVGIAEREESQYGTIPQTGEIVRTESLRKVFYSGTHEIRPLDEVDFTANRGEMIAIVGASGTGKSTFLHLLAALDTPTSGAVYFARNSLQSFAESELAQYRNRSVGFVWQRHHLLPDFTAAENVAMPLLLSGKAMEPALRTAEEWLGEVGLGDRAVQQTGALSGGEQQRVAIARALVNQPTLLLADEPTGDLDERSAEGIFGLMQRLHDSHHLTSIIATHNLTLARRANRVLKLERGKLSPAMEVLDGAASFQAQPVSTGAKTPGERG
jgi:lipoprotein-releasing system ATP-binding protein